jgi:hypothetical protein
MIVASSMLVLDRRFTLVERSRTLVFRGRASECLVSKGVVGFPLLVLVQEEVSGSLRIVVSVYSTIRLRDSCTYPSSTGS